MATQTEIAVNQALNNNADTKQFLTFRLGDEEYGVDILKVQEIKGFVPTTRIPNSPPEVIGVLNLRGTIVPITDLRTKFGMPAAEYTQFNAIIVVVVNDRIMGMVVDSVSEVTTIPEADIQPTSEFSSTDISHYLQGMGKIGEKLIILLDIEAVLACTGAIEAVAA